MLSNVLATSVFNRNTCYGHSVLPAPAEIGQGGDRKRDLGQMLVLDAKELQP